MNRQPEPNDFLEPDTVASTEMAHVVGGHQAPTIDRALSRLLAEIHDGLRHGFFEFTLTCEVVGQERRRLTLQAGKSHQFLIPKDECVRATAHHRDSSERSDDR